MFTNNIYVRFHPGLEIDGDEVITIICRYPPPIVVSPPPPIIPAPIQWVQTIKKSSVTIVSSTWYFGTRDPKPSFKNRLCKCRKKNACLKLHFSFISRKLCIEIIFYMMNLKWKFYLMSTVTMPPVQFNQSGFVSVHPTHILIFVIHPSIQRNNIFWLPTAATYRRGLKLIAEDDF